ncbi:MAG: 30S ribosomal protein S12 methylthiotransferase RimO [Anaerolineae bacterium]
MRFHFMSLGCPKNTVDAEMMTELLRQAGHKLVENPRTADILIVNTCGFIEPARDESYGALRELAAHKRRGQKLIAAGCLAQRDGAAIRQVVPGVDAVIGTRSWSQIVEVVSSFGLGPQQGGRDLVELSGDVVASVQRRAALGASAYLKIADGCDAGCAFCAIPLIKGPQASKPADEVLREARELAAQGVREAVLIAQDSTAYGRDLGEVDALAKLIQRLLAEVPDVAWLRLMYAYPQHVTPRLVEILASSPRICHYLDIPLQHGHPDMLRRMRRPHDVNQVYALVAALREAMPDIALRSTFIVGFPGETEPEFEGLLRFMDEIAFDKVGVFAYSREEGTAAALFPNQVPPEVIAERHERAMLAQQRISLRRNQAQVGRELQVLVEGVGEGLSVGRSYREAPEIDGLVLVPGEHPVGAFLPVRVVEGQEYDLIAETL